MEMRTRRNHTSASAGVPARKSSRGSKKDDDADFTMLSPQSAVDLVVKRNVVANFKKTVLAEVRTRRESFAATQKSTADIIAVADCLEEVQANSATVESGHQLQDQNTMCGVHTTPSLVSARNGPSRKARPHSPSATGANSSEERIDALTPAGVPSEAPAPAAASMGTEKVSPQSQEVHLAEGGGATISRAFRPEACDAIQRDAIPPSASTVGQTRGLTQSGEAPSPSVVPDLFSDKVSLLSSVPAAMQHQQQHQYSLSMAMSGAGGSSQPPSNSPIMNALGRSGPYLSGAVPLGAGSGGSASPSRPAPKLAIPTSLSGTTLPVAKVDTPRGVMCSPRGSQQPPASTKVSPVSTPSRPSDPSLSADVQAVAKGAEKSAASADTSAAQLSSSPSPSRTQAPGGPATGSGKSLQGSLAALATAELKESVKLDGGGRPSGKLATHHGPSRPHSNSHGGSSRDKDDGHMMLVKRHDMLKAKLAAIERREMLAYRAPPLKLPRLKSHWDYVLDEMQWMAVDFRQERRWKKAESRAVGGLCAEAVGLKNTCYVESIAPVSRDIQYTLWTAGLESLTRGALYVTSMGPNRRYIDLKNTCKAQAAALRRGLLRAFVGTTKVVEFSEDDAEVKISRAQTFDTDASNVCAESTLMVECPNQAPTTKVKKDPFVLTEQDLLSLDEAVTTKYGTLWKALREQSSDETDLLVRGNSQGLALNRTERRAAAAVLRRCAQGLGCLVTGNHSTGKTTACAAVVASWACRRDDADEHGPGNPRPAMIVCSRYRVDRWKYEIAKFYPDCSFLVLDDEFSFGSDKTIPVMSVANFKLIATNRNVVFCCCSDFLRRKTEDGGLQSVVGMMADLRWSGVMVDLRSLAGHVGSGKATLTGKFGPCWDCDGIVCNSSIAGNAPVKSSKAAAENFGSLALADPLATDKLQAAKNVHILYAMWIQSVTFAFPDVSVSRCCISGFDFLGASAASVLSTDSLRSLIASWLCFSVSSAFRDTSPEHTALASERWILWQNHQYGDKSLLLDGLIPLGRMSLPFSGESPAMLPRHVHVKAEPETVEIKDDAMEEEDPHDSTRIEAACQQPLCMSMPEIIPVLMTQSQSAKYSAIMMHLCAHAEFVSVKDTQSPKFEQFAKTLVLLRRICFHEDLVYISTPDWPRTDANNVVHGDSRKFVVHCPLRMCLISDCPLDGNATCDSHSNPTKARPGVESSSVPSDVRASPAHPPNVQAKVANSEVSTPQSIQPTFPALHATCQYPAEMRLFDSHRAIPSCGKFDALLDIISENYSSKSPRKVAIVVSTYDEHLFTHRFLCSRHIPHLFAGVPDIPFHGDHMLPNWYAAQVAVRNFNRAANTENGGHAVILVCSWLFSAEGLDESHSVYASFSSMQPVSAGIIVSLSSDWLFEMDFSSWLIGIDEHRDCTAPRRVLRLVYERTIEETMFDLFVWNSSGYKLGQMDLTDYCVLDSADHTKDLSALHNAISSDVRLRCPLSYLQGKSMDEIYDYSPDAPLARMKLGLDERFMRHAPILSPRSSVQKALQKLFVAPTIAPPAQTAVNAEEGPKEDGKEGEHLTAVAACEAADAESKKHVETAVENKTRPSVPLGTSRTEIAAAIKIGREWITLLRYLARKVENDFSAVVLAKSTNSKSKIEKKKKNLAPHTWQQRSRHTASRFTIPLPAGSRASGGTGKAGKLPIGATKTHGRGGSIDSKTIAGVKVRQQCEVSLETHRYFCLLVELEKYFSNACINRTPPSGAGLSSGMTVYLAKTLTRLHRSTQSMIRCADGADVSDHGYTTGIMYSLWDSRMICSCGMNEVIYRVEVEPKLSIDGKRGSDLRSLYQKRYICEGFGISSSAHLFRLINEPTLRPRISVNDTSARSRESDKSSTVLGVDLKGADNISAYKSTCAELKRRGQLLDPRIYANPLQMTTGQDVVTCPSWLENASRVTDLPLTVSYGSASMCSTAPQIMYAANGKGSNKSRKPMKTAAETSRKKPGVAAAPGDAVETSLAEPVVPAVETTPSVDSSVPALSAAEAIVKYEPKNPYPAAAMRFHQNGSGWRQFGPSGRSVSELSQPFASAGAGGSAFLAELPLGRDGEKYSHVGERRVGGYPPPGRGHSSWGFAINMKHQLSESGDEIYQSHTYDLRRLGGSERAGCQTSDDLPWTESEDSAIFAASRLMTTTRADSSRYSSPCNRKGDAYAGSGWLMQRMLEQCPPLAASGCKSSRHAVGHKRKLMHSSCVEGECKSDMPPSNKRHFEEVSTDTSGFPESLMHPKKLLKLASFHDRHSAHQSELVGCERRPRDSSLDEQLLERVAGRIRRVLESSRVSGRVAGERGRFSIDNAQTSELMQMHSSHEVATACSNASLNPVQIYEMNSSPSNSVDQACNQAREDPPRALAPALNPTASSRESCHRGAGACSSPCVANNPQARSATAARAFNERTSPYLLASAPTSNPVSTSPYLMPDQGREVSESAVPAFSALPSSVSTLAGSGGHPGNSSVHMPRILSMDSSGLLPQVLGQDHGASATHTRLGEDGPDSVNSFTESASTLIDSRNLSHLKQVDPRMKAQVINILSQHNISDHRKGELLRSLMDRTRGSKGE